MVKIMRVKRTRREIIYGVLYGVLTVLFLSWGVLILRLPYLRLWDGLKDVGTSIAYFFTNFFFPGLVKPTVNNVPGYVTNTVPETWAGFQGSFMQFLRLLVDWENFKSYFVIVGSVFEIVVTVIVIALPFIILAVWLFRRTLKKQNNKHNYETKPLRVFKKISAVTYIPVKNFITGFFDFLRQRRKLIKIWLLLALLNFNVFTIGFELLAYLFYIMGSMSFVTFYIQFYKLLIDIGVLLDTVPWWVWLLIGFIIFLRLRRKIAYARLRSFEARNRGFINSLPITAMACGSMGTKKTTMLTDMALSQAVMFRDKAHEKLLENDLKFPNFPWINFENDLKAAMKRHDVFNLASCKKFVADKYKQFSFALYKCKKRGITPISGTHPDLCFGYDYSRYGMTYDDKLKLLDLFDVLETYAQLYFIYVIESSLVLSNYSVRTDSVMLDRGNFPLWDSDFFRRDSREIDEQSRYAHVLDFDMLRLGKKLIENNNKRDAFEFGVVVITEAGKERGNQVENKGKKKDDESANQLNDGFNRGLKMIRHSATVDHFPFVRVIMDEQRPDSLGADARQLTDIVHIRKSSEQHLALPFFYVESLAYEFLFPRFESFYYNHRFNRGDTTLSLYLAKKLSGILHRYYTRTYNLFSFCILNLDKERGTQDAAPEACKYYLSSKKIYSKRFATDAFNDYYKTKTLRSVVGLADLEEYETDRASMDELSSQNSYFINELEEYF